MSQASSVFDLGDLDRAASDPGSSDGAPSELERPARPREVRRRPSRSIGSAQSWSGRDLGESLSVVIPGFGQIVRGDVSVGLFFLTSLGLVAALVWALTGSVGRLTETLPLLGYPPAAAVWALGGLFVTAAILHLGCVLNAGSGLVSAPKPVVAAIASLLIPGWGQLLNGDRYRAVFFLGMLWLVGAGWILVSPAAQHLMADLRLYLPSWASVLVTPAARWTVPAIVWTLSVYDAASRAAGRRGVSH